MKLFSLVNYKLTISEEAYALKPFKAIWDRDKLKDKKVALAELAYIYYIEDFKSDFADILDEGERRREILPNLDLPKSWKEDKVVKEARGFYRKRSETIALLYLKDVRFAVNQVRIYLREVNLLAVDDKGKPIYDVTKLTRVIEGSDALLGNLNKLERRIQKEIEEESNVRGDRVKSIFEDGI